MEERKLLSLDEYCEEFDKSGEKDFYVFLERKRNEAMANGDQELVEHIDTIHDQAWEDAKKYEEMIDFETEQERQQKDSEYYDDYYREVTAEPKGQKESTIKESEGTTTRNKKADIGDSVIRKIQALITYKDKYLHTEDAYLYTEAQLSEEEHNVFMEMIAHIPYLQQDKNYIKDIHRKKYDEEYDDISYDATPEQLAEYDRTNGNDYISIRIGKELFLNEDFDRTGRTSSIKLRKDRLYGDNYGQEYDYEEEFEIPEIITPETLLEGLQGVIIDLSSLSVEKLQKAVSENNKQVLANDEEIKQALIQRILEQQQTIAKQEQEISKLKRSQEELE